MTLLEKLDQSTVYTTRLWKCVGGLVQNTKCTRSLQDKLETGHFSWEGSYMYVDKYFDPIIIIIGQALGLPRCDLYCVYQQNTRIYGIPMSLVTRCHRVVPQKFTWNIPLSLWWQQRAHGLSLFD
jgi:hypothetical protein